MHGHHHHWCRCCRIRPESLGWSSSRASQRSCNWKSPNRSRPPPGQAVCPWTSGVVAWDLVLRCRCSHLISKNQEGKSSLRSGRDLHLWSLCSKKDLKSWAYGPNVRLWGRPPSRQQLCYNRIAVGETDSYCYRSEGNMLRLINHYSQSDQFV